MARRKTILLPGLLIAVLSLLGCANALIAETPERHPDNEDGVAQDMLTPAYYHTAEDGAFREEINRFVFHARQVPFQHPFSDSTGHTPSYFISAIGSFGASKGPQQDTQHHPAIDLYVSGRASAVDLYAAYDGVVTTFRDAEKYRHYLAITHEVAEAGEPLGKIVTLYAHIDLDLDEADGLFMNGQVVEQGDLVSRHLYSGTMGGPHLHFEIRYYRSGDLGDETFYGGRSGPMGNPDFTEATAGIWDYGYWHPDVGYGFADPRNYGIAD